MIADKQYYLDTFKVSVEQMESVIGTALKSGGDYADLFFENSHSTHLVLQDGEVTSGGCHQDYGVGIRTLKGDKTGYAYSESTELKDMIAAAKAASVIAEGFVHSGQVETKPSVSFPGKPNPSADRYPIIKDWRAEKASSFIPILDRLKTKIEQKDGRIVKIILMLSTRTTDVMMFNSHLELKYETRPMATLAASVILQNEEKTINTHVSRSYRMGAEMLTENLLDELTESALKDIDPKFEAIRPKGGQMPVVMGAGASGILLHESMGHAFEADFNRKGQSIFADKIGKKICNENITIVDDGTLKHDRGSINYDDEGVPAQKTYMVKDGILTSFLHDRISAKFYDVHPTGNGRRESFRFNPVPRMRSTYMESSSENPQDIISSVKNGIYVDEFSNGQVQIGKGDFTFYVKSGFLIENGKLTAPIKDINITGNGPEALADIIAVGNDGRIDPGAWTCGKEQNVPVSCGIPTVLVKKLIVGGE